MIVFDLFFVRAELSSYELRFGILTDLSEEDSLDFDDLLDDEFEDFEREELLSGDADATLSSYDS